MIRWILYIAGGLLALVALVALVGALLPRDHVASRSARYRQPPEAVWAAISSLEDGAGWRSTVDRVERLPDRDGHAVWREHGDYGPMTMEVVESTPPRRMVTRIADPDLPFGGTWTYEVTPEGDGARLTLTEDGFVSNVFFRFMSRFVFGHTATMETYLVDLGRHFGEEVTPEAPPGS